MASKFKCFGSRKAYLHNLLQYILWSTGNRKTTLNLPNTRRKHWNLIGWSKRSFSSIFPSKVKRTESSETRSSQKKIVNRASRETHGTPLNFNEFFVQIVPTTSALSNLYCKTYESARIEQFLSLFIITPAVLHVNTTNWTDRDTRDKFIARTQATWQVFWRHLIAKARR